MEETTIVIAETAKGNYVVGYLERGEITEPKDHQYYGDAQSDAGIRQLSFLSRGKIARVIEMETLINR